MASQHYQLKLDSQQSIIQKYNQSTSFQKIQEIIKQKIQQQYQGQFNKDQQNKTDQQQSQQNVDINNQKKSIKSFFGEHKKFLLDEYKNNQPKNYLSQYQNKNDDEQNSNNYQSSGLDQLPEPNNIIENNFTEIQGKKIQFKYTSSLFGSDKDQFRVQFDYNDQFREKNYEDKQIWKTRPKEEIVHMYTAGQFQNHECDPQIERILYRCKQCQKTLKWVFFSTSRIQPNSHIIYNEFQDIVQRLREESDISIVENFTNLETVSILREFSYIIVQRPEGLGFLQIQEKTNLQIQPSLIQCSSLKIRSQNPDFRHELQFFADYENANLQKIVFMNDPANMKEDYNFFRQQQSNEIENIFLILKNDTNTKGLTQWFNFGIQYFGKKTKTYKFTILNYKKKIQMYNSEFRIHVAKIGKNFYDSIQKVGLEWSRGCFDISCSPNKFIKNMFVKTKGNNTMDINLNNNLQYSENIDHQYLEKMNLKESNFPGCQTYYSLEFSYTFRPNEQFGYLFAQTQPYTFTELINFLNQCEIMLKSDDDMDYDFDVKQRIINIKSQDIQYKKQILGSSKMGFPLFKVQITATNKPPKYQNSLFIPPQNRKIIVIIARQHPSDAPSSYMCEGIVKLLLDPNNNTAKLLRQNFIFEIIPMANPDGVIVGNSKSNLSGLDMNKRWEFADPVQDPEVYQIKIYLLKLKQEIFMLFDLHSSIQKSGCFMIGNEWPSNYNSFNWVGERLFQKIMNVLSSPFFDLSNCSFESSASQETIQRFSWKKLRVQHSFTLEVSMHGYSQAASNKNNNNKDFAKSVLEFSQTDYENIGEKLLECIILYTFLKEKMRAEARNNSGELSVPGQLQEKENNNINKKSLENNKTSIDNEKLFSAWNANTPPQEILEFDIQSYMEKSQKPSVFLKIDSLLQKEQNEDAENKLKSLNSHPKRLTKSSKSLKRNQSSNNNNLKSHREMSEIEKNQLMSTQLSTQSPIQSKNKLIQQEQKKPQSAVQQQQQQHQKPLRIPQQKKFRVSEDVPTQQFNKQILDQLKFIRKTVKSDEYLDWKYFFSLGELDSAFMALKKKVKHNFNELHKSNDYEDSEEDLLDSNRKLKLFNSMNNQLKGLYAKSYRSQTANSKINYSPKTKEIETKKTENDENKILKKSSTYIYPGSYSEFQKIQILDQNKKNFERQQHFQKKNNLIYLSFDKTDVRPHKNTEEVNGINNNNQLVKSQSAVQQNILVKNPFVQPQMEIYQVVEELDESKQKEQIMIMKQNTNAFNPFIGLSYSNQNNLYHIYKNIQEQKTFRKIIPKKAEDTYSSSRFYTEINQDNLNKNNKDLYAKTTNFDKITEQNNDRHSQSIMENIENVIKSYKNKQIKKKIKITCHIQSLEKLNADTSKKQIFQFYDPKKLLKVKNVSFQNQTMQKSFSRIKMGNQTGSMDDIQQKSGSKTPIQRNSINQVQFKLNLLDAISAKQQIIQKRRPNTARGTSENNKSDNNNSKKKATQLSNNQNNYSYKLDKNYYQKQQQQQQLQ